MPKDLMKVAESSPAELDQPTLSFVQERAEAIRGIARQTAENVVRIGEHLVAVKERLGHGNWLPWLEAEFGWTDRTAERFIQVYKLVKSDKLSNLPAFEVSALYLLAAPGTPEPVRQITANVAASGQKVTHKLVKQKIALVKTMADKPASDPPIIDDVADPDGGLHSEPVDQRLALIADTEYKRLQSYLLSARKSVPSHPSAKVAKAMPQQRRDDLRRRAERLHNWAGTLLQWLDAADSGED